MYYVIRNDRAASDAIAQSLYAEFRFLDDAKQYADNEKKVNGHQYNIFKVEWVTTTPLRPLVNS